MKNLKYLAFGILALFVVIANVKAAVCTDDTCEAQVGTVKYDTLANAIAAAEDKAVVELLKDITISNKIAVEKDGEITIDGKGFKVTATAQKAFEVYAKDDADDDTDKSLKITFKNIKIENTYKSTSSKGARAIDTRTDHIELVVESSELSTTNPDNIHAQPVTIGGSDTGRVKVTITDTTITGGDLSYAFITYLPVDLKVENSNISGWAALYFNLDRWSTTPAYSSKGSVATIINSILSGEGAKNAHPSNAFGTIAIDSEDVQINIIDSIVKAEGEAAIQTPFAADEAAKDIEVSIAGDKSEVIVSNANKDDDALAANSSLFDITISGGKFNTDVKEYLEEGTKLDETTGKVLKEHKITVAETTEGTVTVDKKEAIAGETVKVSVTAKDGYKVKSITANKVEVKDNKFVMPNEDVKVEVTFEKVVVAETTPEADKPVSNVDTNPKTGDEILTYGIVGLIALLGLGITFKHKRTN